MEEEKSEMSDNLLQSAGVSADNMEARANSEAALENSKQKASPEPVKKTPRFMVENVESPTKASPDKTKESVEFSYPDPAETIGFATHEAVPMTMFYRNASSIGDNAQQRPTLRDLHEGFDLLDEEMVSKRNNYIYIYLEPKFIHDIYVKTRFIYWVNGLYSKSFCTLCHF